MRSMIDGSYKADWTLTISEDEGEVHITVNTKPAWIMIPLKPRQVDDLIEMLRSAKAAALLKS